MLTVFYLKSCPYCKQALRDLDIHRLDYPNIMIEFIEESEQPDIANQFDYYYVPCFYQGTIKLHEGAISEEEIVGLLKKL